MLIAKIVRENFKNNTKDAIVGLLAYEKDIELTDENYGKLYDIVETWFRGEDELLNDCFITDEYDTFDEDQKDLLGIW